jgi:hypothetical protein
MKLHFPLFEYDGAVDRRKLRPLFSFVDSTIEVFQIAP